jgi:hypothetical protein
LTPSPSPACTTAGPAVELAPFQIEVVQDLPVGKNLQDHPAVFLNFLTDRNR